MLLGCQQEVEKDTMTTQQTTAGNNGCCAVFVSHTKTCVVEDESRTSERRSRGGIKKKMDRNTNIRKQGKLE